MRRALFLSLALAVYAAPALADDPAPAPAAAPVVVQGTVSSIPSEAIVNGNPVLLPDPVEDLGEAGEFALSAYNAGGWVAVIAFAVWALLKLLERLLGKSSFLQSRAGKLLFGVLGSMAVAFLGAIVSGADLPAALGVAFGVIPAALGFNSGVKNTKQILAARKALAAGG